MMYAWNFVFQFCLVENEVLQQFSRLRESTDRNSKNKLLDVPEAKMRPESTINSCKHMFSSPCSFKPGLEIGSCNSILRAHIGLQTFCHPSHPARYVNCKFAVKAILETIFNFVGPVCVWATLVQCSLGTFAIQITSSWSRIHL